MFLQVNWFLSIQSYDSASRLQTSESADEGVQFLVLQFFGEILNHLLLFLRPNLFWNSLGRLNEI